MRYPLLAYGHYAAYPPIPMAARGDNEFTRAFVASACLSAFQGVSHPTSPAQLKRVLRHALQGGTAFAAGARAAAAVRYGDYSGALVSAAVGATGVLLIEQLLRDAARLDEKG
ncbi:hypothetical protein [Azotobacter armeniacus]